MGSALKPALYTIPPHRGFADALVEGIIATHGKSPLGLAKAVILVPNNRAAVAIRDAFVRKSAKGLLMPRLVAIGDSDLGESIGAALDPIDVEPIAPAIDPLRRQMILARKVQQSGLMGSITGAQAMRLAADLGRVLDQLTVERMSTEALRDVDVDGLNDHWARALTFLNFIMEDWPRELERLGCIDLAERRNRQLDRITDQWRSSRPTFPIYAAGISTVAPAIADFLKLVARLDQGAVILDGLDLAMPDDQWDALSSDENGRGGIESHPQYHLSLMLDRIGATRGEVETWGWGGGAKPLLVRFEAITRAMAPAAFTKSWSTLPPEETKLSGVKALQVATPADEAQSISLAIRAAVQEPGKTVALITPDRELARRVSAHLKRWGIQADDSAGQPLSATPPGVLLLSLAQGAAERFAPSGLLAILKHLLVNGGDVDGRQAWLDGARKLDLALRGPLPVPGLAGIDALLADQNERTASVKSAALEWWAVQKHMFESVDAAARQVPQLEALLQTLTATATALTGGRIWAGPDGRALADLLSDLSALSGEGMALTTLADLPALLRDLMDAQAIRPAFGGHPRVFIWGLIEAKLQRADTVILGGLNEGVWPQLISPDPWLAPVIRRQLGLPVLERRIGLSAHDLVGAMGASNVLMTRAKRDGSSPTTESRFWLRLTTLAGGIGSPQTRFDLLAQALDFATGMRANPPAPAPPIHERPRKLSVTDADTLKADPYSFYAKAILRLTALDEPGAEPDARWRGTFLHDVLHHWGKDDGFARAALIPRLQAAFDSSGLHPVLRALWLPRFEEAAQTFQDKLADLAVEGRVPAGTEMQGEVALAGVTLRGRADRIDRLADGGIGIVDYKTGTAPSKKEIEAGMRLQLGLLGLMAERGGFAGVAGKAGEFDYWSQAKDTTTKAYGKISSALGKGSSRSDPDDFLAQTLRHFEQVVSDYLLGDAAFKAKLHPEMAYSEFDQLMRYDEWQGRDG